MIPYQVLNTVLKYLKVSQINELRHYNRFLNNFIGQNRIALPGTPVHQVEIFSGEDGMCWVACNKDEKWFRIVVDIDKRIEYLIHLRPKVVRLKGDYITQDADSEWFKTINYLSADYITNEEEFYKMIRKLNCPSLNFANVEIPLNADEVLKSMPYVVNLMIRVSSHSTDFFTNLVEKTKLGPGMDSLIFTNISSSPIHAEDFIKFLENAKFRHNIGITCYNVFIDVHYIYCKIEEFSARLTELVNRKGWRSVYTDLGYRKVFQIWTPLSKIMLRVASFRYI